MPVIHDICVIVSKHARRWRLQSPQQSDRPTAQHAYPASHRHVVLDLTNQTPIIHLEKVCLPVFKYSTFAHLYMSSIVLKFKSFNANSYQTGWFRRICGYQDFCFRESRVLMSAVLIWWHYTDVLPITSNIFCLQDQCCLFTMCDRQDNHFWLLGILLLVMWTITSSNRTLP